MEILNYLIDFFTSYGYLDVFLVLIACGFGLPIPEDITLVAGGIICALSIDSSHPLNIHIMFAVAMVGVTIGDSVMFMLGRLLGDKVKSLPGLKYVFTENNYAKIQEKAQKYGDKILFVARFLPGLRAPIFLTAGISHRVSYWKFILMDGSAAVISVPIWVYLGYFLANDLSRVLKWVEHAQLTIIGVVVVVILLVVVVKWLKKKKI